MNEWQTQKIEKQDINAPNLKSGESAIVFQRHGKYSRDRDAADAGSLLADDARDIYGNDQKFFQDLLKDPEAAEDVYAFFVSSDTQYAGKGHRSMETGQLAQNAAREAFESMGLDPNEHIINFNPDFKTARHDETDQDIRPMAGIREPQIFNPEDEAYFKLLQEKYGYADEEHKTGLTPKGWAMHEMDAEREARLATNAEGEQDLMARTDRSLAVLERYARVWHANNPGKKLVIWATSHYDTVSPLVKNAEGRFEDENGDLTDEYLAVDYGAGVVINIPSNPEDEKTMERRSGQRIAVELGKRAASGPVTRLNQPKY